CSAPHCHLHSFPTRTLFRSGVRPCLLLLLLLSLVLSSCSVPGIVTTGAQLSAVKTTPQTISLPPVHFPQDEAAHRDLTEWWYYTDRKSTRLNSSHVSISYAF